MIRSLLVVITLLIATPIFGGWCILAAILGVKDHPHSPYSLAPRFWGRTVLWVAGVRVVEHDKHHAIAPQHIFVANHLSWFDVFALAAHVRWFKFVAKAELFRIPMFGRAMLAAGMIPIERANRKSAFSAYSVATERIGAGASVVVYPEGTRGSAYPLRHFKKGPFVLAIQAQAPIVPVVVHGALEVQAKGSWRIRSGTIHLHYLPAIPSAGMTYDQRGELARQVYEAMAACLEREYGVVSPTYDEA